MRLHRSLAANQPALLLLLLFAASSCIRNRDYIYLQSPAEKAYWDLSPLQSKSLRRAQQAIKAQDSTVFVPYMQPEDYLIQFGDFINITIKTYDEKMNILFGSGSTAQNAQLQVGLFQGDPNFFTGYPVDDSGCIEMPVLGKIQVVGLTLNETQNKIKGLAKLYLTEAFVRVGIGGIRFSIIGDVNRPGKYMVLQNRLTILEAISTAGDLSVSGNRRRVQLIRQYPEGSRIVHLDLTKRDFLSSPYFFLKPNDVIYVPPLRVRELGTGITAQQSMGTILTAISLLVNSILLYNTLRNL